ncbi:unnamed protein product [Orchesella dallaii]|uniref:CRAL-TRIO domain-containing protein n=1 Tax=Orchesella dallaii TaxID=48710 RepID=A0ABP1PHN2_9HEXA
MDGVKILFVLNFLGTLIALGKSEDNAIDRDVLLTLKQKQALDAFKYRISPILPHDYMKEDIYLVRWLRARNFNIPQAEDMLKTHLRWRKATNMDRLRMKDFADISSKYPVYVDTFDKNGAPVIIAANGQWDLREAHLTGNGQRLLLFIDKAMDEAASLIRKAQQEGKNVTRFHWVLNQEGFNLIQHGCPRCFLSIVHFLNSYENNFPGLMDKLIVINAPRSIQVVAPIVRATSSTFESRVQLFSTNKAEWVKYLLEFIDEDQLTEEYGGSRVRQSES